MLDTPHTSSESDGISGSPNNLDAFWMPYSANRQFKGAPRMLKSAKGMYYTTTDGRQILDGTAGLWCCNAGHGREEITRAVQETVAELDYAPTFQMGHPLAFEFASRLTAMAPEPFTNAFFCNSGSEAADSALKIALAYHKVRGEGGRFRLIGRERGYHGSGFGGISVGGIVKNRMYFGTLLAGADHLPHTWNLEHQSYSKGEPEWGAHLADELERIVQLHDASTIAAVMVEPVAGSTGVLIPPQGYLKRLREICDKYGLLLIFDEVITGFGRLGTGFAADYFGVMPDMITLAKGITNAVVPMGAVLVRKEIYDAFMHGPEQAIELFHGYTYSGHPLACAAGLASLEVYKNDGLFDRAAELAPYWEERLHSLKGAPYVRDIRNLGLIGGIELDPIPDAPTKRAFSVFLKCFEKGVMIRTTSDIIALSPPLIIAREEIDRIVETIRDALNEI